MLGKNQLWPNGKSCWNFQNVQCVTKNIQSLAPQQKNPSALPEPFRHIKREKNTEICFSFKNNQKGSKIGKFVASYLVWTSSTHYPSPILTHQVKVKFYLSLTVFSIEVCHCFLNITLFECCQGRYYFYFW